MRWRLTAGEPSLLRTVRGIAAVLVPVVLAGSLIYGGAKLGEYMAGQIGASGTIATQGSGKKAVQASPAPAVNPGQADAPTAPAEGAENDTFSPLKIQSS